MACRTFGTSLEQQVETQADAQKGHARTDAAHDGVGLAALPHVGHRILERAHTRQDHGGGAVDVGRLIAGERMAPCGVDAAHHAL